MGFNKRKKFHDKDKYYNLAKEQGFRSRAAFKLSQINRKFPFLQDAKVVLDLCAAPGGWTQVAARTMAGSASSSNSGGHIVAVDILPIRPFTQPNNITTLIGDITTAKCKADITSALRKIASSKHTTTDLVLHDGAPNVGASYDKDAYEQNEIAVHALRCATQHLRKGGNYITKVYRSRDYSSYVWVCQQLFDEVTAFKPKASRIQSAEIFLVCQNYKAPTKIDPKLLDPKYIFEAATEGANDAEVNTEITGGMTVFHKSWDQKKRQRNGYDMDFLDATMRHIQPVSDFIEANTMKDAIQILSQCTGLTFQDDDKKNNKKTKDTTKDEDDDDDDKPQTSNSQFYLNHPLTTPEIKSCLMDLKVLNKSDFKGLMNWRDKMIQAVEEINKKKKKKDDDDDDDDNDEEEEEEENDSEKEEELIQGEISERIQKRLREKKRQKKKEREKAAKRRRDAAFGMDLNAIDVPEHDKTFSLATITTKGDLEAAAEINLDQVNDDAFVSSDEEEEPVKDNDRTVPDKDEETGYSYRLDDELDAAYDRYLSTTKDGLAKAGTKMAKRSKKVQRMKVLEEAEEDEEIMMTSQKGIHSDLKKYAKLLHGTKENDSDDDDDSDDESDDGFHAEPLTPEEFQKRKAQKEGKDDNDDDSDDDDDDDESDDDDDESDEDTPAKKKQRKKEQKERNPLIHEFDEPASAKTARWFSNPLFSSIGQTAESASAHDATNQGAINKATTIDVVMDSSSEDEEESKKSNKKKNKNKKSKEDKDDAEDDSKNDNKNKKKKIGISADEVLAMMPKTDKQIRHEKRLKAMAREERKKARRAKQAGEMEAEFEVAPAENDDDDDDDDDNLDDNLNTYSEEQKQKILEARKLIKAGMGTIPMENDDDGGKNKKGNKKNNNKLDIVPADDDDDDIDDDRPLPVKDDRVYNSENEDYDSDDHARTLALGTMILRKSKEKALVDASYNRYAWNDPVDLPEWFVDDENRYYRPQLPIPPALVAKMKEKMMALAAKPIAKVAEARARKRNRAKQKLAAAKKKAAAVANSTEMSEAMKLKAISKTLRQGESAGNKKQTNYIVAKKGRGARQGGVKGAKVVDKRMKSDKRAMERKAKKKKFGKKQGGLTGSKKRRHHS